MTITSIATLPKSEVGNDPNDPTFISKIKPESILNKFSLNGESTDMKAKMLDDKFILGRLAILGQSTVFFAAPGAGKALLTNWLLIDSIKINNVVASDIFYVNADDNYKGLANKLSIAERYGFQMLAPGHHEFKANMLVTALLEMVATDMARGKVIILDTLKKFTDIMDKRASTKFGDVFRQFFSKGGSIIMLANVNKHSDAEGKPIYAGTSDIVDDADCVYTLQVIEENDQGKVVEFINIKDRGDVDKKALFAYSNVQGTKYDDLLGSVSQLDESESNRITAQNIVKNKLDKSQLIISEIITALTNDINGKTEIVTGAVKATGES
jgi:hypothetical protein